MTAHKGMYAHSAPHKQICTEECGHQRADNDIVEFLLTMQFEKSTGTKLLNTITTGQVYPNATQILNTFPDNRQKKMGINISFYLLFLRANSQYVAQDYDGF